MTQWKLYTYENLPEKYHHYYDYKTDNSKFFLVKDEVLQTSANDMEVLLNKYLTYYTQTLLESVIIELQLKQISDYTPLLTKVFKVSKEDVENAFYND